MGPHSTCMALNKGRTVHMSCVGGSHRKHTFCSLLQAGNVGRYNKLVVVCHRKTTDDLNGHAVIVASSLQTSSRYSQMQLTSKLRSLEVKGC